jgi:hypothetical protein
VEAAFMWRQEKEWHAPKGCEFLEVGTCLFDELSPSGAASRPWHHPRFEANNVKKRVATKNGAGLLKPGATVSPRLKPFSGDGTKLFPAVTMMIWREGSDISERRTSVDHFQSHGGALLLSASVPPLYESLLSVNAAQQRIERG